MNSLLFFPIAIIAAGLLTLLFMLIAALVFFVKTKLENLIKEQEIGK